jgi:hypothetical protein
MTTCHTNSPPYAGLNDSKEELDMTGTTESVNSHLGQRDVIETDVGRKPMDWDYVLAED